MAKGQPLVGTTRNLVLSPIVIAMWKPMAEALGWPAKPIGWSDILTLAGKSPDSSLVRFESVGLKVDVPGTFCEPPRADVIEALLHAWQRSRNP